MKTTHPIDNEFPRLDDDILSAVPSLKDPDGPGAPIHASATRLHEMQDERKRIIGDLSQWSRDCPDPAAPVTAEQTKADCEFLLSGGDLEQIHEALPTDERRTLVRRLRAIEQALPALEHQVRETSSRVVLSELAKLQPVGRALYEEVLSAFEHLAEMIEAWHEFDRLLSRAGFDHQMRVGQWEPTAHESHLLHGGGGWPSIPDYVRLRKEMWGIDEKG